MLLAVAFAEALATSLAIMLFGWSTIAEDRETSESCYCGSFILGTFVIASSACVIWGAIS